MALDRLKVWQWLKKYEDSQVCDGGGWTLSAAAHGKQVTSEGRNAAPDAKAPRKVRSVASESGQSGEDLLVKAIEALIEPTRLYPR
jgi:hypothetical protein